MNEQERVTSPVLQALWFAGLWLTGVTSVASFAYVLRWITQLAYGV